MANTGTPLLAGAYFDFLFGEDHGWACIRTFKGGHFGHKDGPIQRHWFKWPQQRDEMIAFTLANSTLDLYIIPALFENNASNRASNIKHQTMVYVDADGAGPELFLVPPTITMGTTALSCASSVSPSLTLMRRRAATRAAGMPGSSSVSRAPRTTSHEAQEPTSSRR
jgi:hypothetical protein